MMFYMHSMFALELIALVSGVALLIFIKKQTKKPNPWAVFVAWFVIILSVLSIICSAYHAIAAWNKGCFNMYDKMTKCEQMMDNKSMRNKKQNNRYMMD